ncbi:hypothetical protein LCGC14_2779030 [marine sediment metagenome]|uniref:adenylyl-sulfate kinase n=1 Tax=marine sediment metagenome TaxID=412755 RepID=A0A0F8YTW2_9ZZZZ
MENTGFTIFLTGLSGSGKSTIAESLTQRIIYKFKRKITILDGDIIRTNLSSELGFSKEHRDLNIRRVGYVASEIVRHGGIVICAAIAPYDTIRKEVRELIEFYGGFVLVYLSTPLSVCEERDVKGLYAKARSGEIKKFTGISDPYEEPHDAEIFINTEGRFVDDCVDLIIVKIEEMELLLKS